MKWEYFVENCMPIGAVGKETTAFCYFLFNLFLTSVILSLFLVLCGIAFCFVDGGSSYSLMPLINTAIAGYGHGVVSLAVHWPPGRIQIETR